MSDAWNEGYHSYSNNYNMEDNPYDTHTREHNEWKRGWLASQSETDWFWNS